MVQMEEPRSRIKSSYYLDENVFATDSAMVSETDLGLVIRPLKEKHNF